MENWKRAQIEATGTEDNRDCSIVRPWKNEFHSFSNNDTIAGMERLFEQSCSFPRRIQSWTNRASWGVSGTTAQLIYSFNFQKIDFNLAPAPLSLSLSPTSLSVIARTVSLSLLLSPTSVSVTAYSVSLSISLSHPTFLFCSHLTLSLSQLFYSLLSVPLSWPTWLCLSLFRFHLSLSLSWPSALCLTPFPFYSHLSLCLSSPTGYLPLLFPHSVFF